MTFTARFELASGQSLKDMPLELLADGVAVARAKADETGKVLFEVSATATRWAIRVDRTILGA
ncbi:hypothetical protein [Pseudomonas vanderleydeniana]|uniref:Uncharacterized protein n=1 Tax=Pseudomonas vanderleydeniana TaxID=2745495 RepID=A0A9E6PNB1_9PSED|nr:hypothetical protein [Pseudomonas vanderleydeniana]QXI29432.1 hypothetical protein HU752_005580 [Pseudomonas vanderleydeniana]